MNIMIIAHTDDELLWGWKDLEYETDWLVICVFQQYNFKGADTQRLKRFNSFKKSSEIYNFKYILLDFIDNPNDKLVNYSIQNDMKKKIIENLPKEYNKIVTHGPEGEYGHYHHKIVLYLLTLLFIHQFVDKEPD